MYRQVGWVQAQPNDGMLQAYVEVLRHASRASKGVADACQKSWRSTASFCQSQQLIVSAGRLGQMMRCLPLSSGPHVSAQIQAVRSDSNLILSSAELPTAASSCLRSSWCTMSGLCLQIRSTRCAQKNCLHANIAC